MQNNKPSLLVLAAGMGSRYGSLKQMDAFGPNGESIIDYSIYDAIEAGFKRGHGVVRVTRGVQAGVPSALDAEYQRHPHAFGRIANRRLP